jgi:hypothetical protein
MKNSGNFAPSKAGSPIEHEPRALTLEETTQVGGGCPLVVVAIAVACAVLLAHD